jgi:hypothetical protein
MNVIRWIQRQGIEPSFVYRAQVEQVGPRQARTLSIEGPIRNVGIERRGTPKVQERTFFDHGGHLIASRFGGPNRRVNMVAMHGNINMSGGEWYRMENEISEMLRRERRDPQSGVTIVERTGTMKVLVQYAQTELLRPVSFCVEARSSRGEVRVWRHFNFGTYLTNPKRPVAQAIAQEIAEDAFGKYA